MVSWQYFFLSCTNDFLFQLNLTHVTLSKAKEDSTDAHHIDVKALTWWTCVWQFVGYAGKPDAYCLFSVPSHRLWCVQVALTESCMCLFQMLQPDGRYFLSSSATCPLPKMCQLMTWCLGPTSILEQRWVTFTLIDLLIYNRKSSMHKNPQNIYWMIKIRPNQIYDLLVKNSNINSDFIGGTKMIRNRG